MKKTLKILLIIAAVIFIPIYLFYAFGFGLQLIGFADAVSKVGLREALVSPQGSEMEFYASITWLVIMIISIYIIPIILFLTAMIYFLKRRRKTK